jgi:hypothetical protein
VLSFVVHVLFMATRKSMKTLTCLYYRSIDSKLTDFCQNRHFVESDPPPGGLDVTQRQERCRSARRFREDPRVLLDFGQKWIELPIYVD